MVTIENAQLQQAEELLEIYAWYVQNTAITFEWDVPSLTEFRQRIADTQTRFPGWYSGMGKDPGIWLSQRFSSPESL